jgi:hypothetical protein
MARTYDRNGIQFATWMGPGRDPEVAYLDATQLVIGSAELTTDGLHLFATGRSFNTLRGEVQGVIDRSVLHRILHTVLDRDGSQWFHLDGPDNACDGTGELCEVAMRTPTLDIPYHEPGSFHLDVGFALQWVTWTEPVRVGVLRRAVYLDGSYLLEAGLGTGGSVRAWPSRGLSPHGLELMAPTANEAGRIEQRIAHLTRGAP